MRFVFGCSEGRFLIFCQENSPCGEIAIKLFFVQVNPVQHVSEQAIVTDYIAAIEKSMIHVVFLQIWLEIGLVRDKGTMFDCSHDGVFRNTKILCCILHICTLAIRQILHCNSQCMRIILNSIGVACFMTVDYSYGMITILMHIDTSIPNF